MRHSSRLASARSPFKWAGVAEDREPIIQGVLGWCAYQAGEYVESIEASERALELDPQIASAAFNLALASLISGRATEARGAFVQGVAICEGLKPEVAAASLAGAMVDLDALLGLRPELISIIAEFKQSLEEAKRHTGS